MIRPNYNIVKVQVENAAENGIESNPIVLDSIHVKMKKKITIKERRGIGTPGLRAPHRSAAKVSVRHRSGIHPPPTGPHISVCQSLDQTSEKDETAWRS